MKLSLSQWLGNMQLEDSMTGRHENRSYSSFVNWLKRRRNQLLTQIVHHGQKWYQFTCKMVLKKYLPQTIYVIVTRIFRRAFIIRGRLFTGTQEHITGFQSTDCSLIGSIVSNWIVKIRVIFLFSLSCFILQYLGLAASSTNFSSPKLNEMAICSIQFTLGLPISHACKIFSEYTLGDHFWRRLWNHRLWSVS